jgi:hypothetical protein
MPPLKGIEQASFGGVDSRSNPVVMPLNRYVKLRNWRPRPDGHIELREGYTQADMSGDADAGTAAIHSISTYMVATPEEGLKAGAQIFTNGTECIFFWRGIKPYLRRLDTGETHIPPIDGAPIESTNRWQYALGKSGYLYMHNGTDMKFFDGVKLRDIGLPILSASQAGAISVAEGMGAPSKANADSVNFTFVPVPAGISPPTQANVTSGYMYMAYFNPASDVLAPCAEPLHGTTFPNGSTSPNPATYFLEVQNIPLPTATPGAVVLLYYPGGAQIPTLVGGTVCTFYSHNGGTYHSAFEYNNAADTSIIGGVLGTPAALPFTLADSDGLLFNPELFFFKGWTLDNGGHIYPMVVAGVDTRGHWNGHVTTISPYAGPGGAGNWTMTVEGQLSIPIPGDYTFVFHHDDGAFIGFGDSATYVSGFIEVQAGGVGPYQTITAKNGYPVCCLRQIVPGAGWTHDSFVVNFPTAGLFHFEIDYCNWQSAQKCCLYNGDGSVILPPGATSVAARASTDPVFLTEDNGQDGALLTAVPGVGGAPSTKVNVHFTGHGYVTGDVFALSLHKDPNNIPDYTTPFSPVLWTSNGPFAATVVDPDNFTFNSSEAPLYNGATPITIYKLVQVKAATSGATTADYIVNTGASGWPDRAQNGRDMNSSGEILLPSPLDLAGKLLPASAIGGTQPGYQFYASIYNPFTGHVGNRVPIGVRLNNPTDCTVLISGLPTIGSMRAAGGAGAAQQLVCWGNGTELVSRKLKQKQKARQGKVVAMATVAFNSEWRLLIGRTGDGGEVPYAVVDAAGNWIFYDPNLDTDQTLTIASGAIDGNSELPTENYIPPPFISFWREGDRLCGAIANSLQVIAALPFTGIPALPGSGFIDFNYTTFWKFRAPGVSGTGIRISFSASIAAACNIVKVVVMRTLAGSTAVVDATTISAGMSIPIGATGAISATFAVDGLHDYWVLAYITDSVNSGCRFAGGLSLNPATAPAQMYGPPGTGDQTAITDVSGCTPNLTGWKLLSNFEILNPTTVDAAVAVSEQPFVYRSGSELDDITGIFVGDPAQAWSPARIETFPTAEPIYGGFGNMQESWVFTRSHCAQLSELSGEVVWNGPYENGIAGPYAFDSGWNSLPFWVSHDRQLVTMMPGGDGPMVVSTEYEAALLARIGDDTYNPDGTPIHQYLSQTEVTYFRDPIRLVDVLRIKCRDKNGDPFVVIHDFNLRDDSSPYGQGYEDIYGGALGVGFTQQHIRDAIGHSRMWAGATDGNLYQFYSGGDDHGTNFTADAIQLRYMGAERTATKTLEWYGDETVQWFISEPMLTVDPSSTSTWILLSFKMIEVPADAGSAHWMADVDRPEMTHCYLWAQLVSHPTDALDPTNPMAFSDPPHMPLEDYGRIYMVTPVLGDARGR